MPSWLHCNYIFTAVLQETVRTVIRPFHFMHQTSYILAVLAFWAVLTVLALLAPESCLVWSGLVWSGLVTHLIDCPSLERGRMSKTYWSQRLWHHSITWQNINTLPMRLFQTVQTHMYIEAWRLNAVRQFERIPVKTGKFEKSDIFSVNTAELIFCTKKLYHYYVVFFCTNLCKK